MKHYLKKIYLVPHPPLALHHFLSLILDSKRGKAGGGKKQLLNSLVGWAGDSEGKKLCQAEGQGGISEGVGCIHAGLQKEIECVVGQVQREYTTK